MRVKVNSPLRHDVFMLCSLADRESKNDVRERMEKKKANGMKLDCDVLKPWSWLSTICGPCLCNSS